MSWRSVEIQYIFSLGENLVPACFACGGFQLCKLSFAFVCFVKLRCLCSPYLSDLFVSWHGQFVKVQIGLWENIHFWSLWFM